MKIKLFVFTLYILTFAILDCIEVGGLITEDTIWDPVNNPYEVTENLIIDVGVTLTILPGTDIKIGSKAITSYSDMYQGGPKKMITVNGRIIAKGTNEANITFSSLSDAPNHCWGTILSSSCSGFSIFEYCDFQEAAGMNINGRNIRAALEFDNENVLIRNCLFKNNWQAMNFNNSLKHIELVNNTFTFDNSYNSFILDNMYGFGIHPDYADNPSLIAGNNFAKSPSIGISASYFVDNFMICTVNNYEDIVPSYIFDNEFIGNGDGIVAHENSISYIKKNTISNTRGIEIEQCYGEIIGNYLNSCVIRAYDCPDAVISHNIIDGSLANVPAISVNCGVVSNNIVMNGNHVFSGASYEQFTNNLFINSNSLFYSFNDFTSITNQIFVGNDDILTHGQDIYGTPVFRNCILDFEIPEGCIDGGGNHIIDPEDISDLFVDYQNEDFHLASGSLAIDAGFNTSGYYPFDLDYNQRVFDGDGDGFARIDIGPYEFGSTQYGKICGFVTESGNDNPLDYVFISIDNDPSNYTFADSAGYFEINLPEGTYDLYANRVYYEPRIIGSVNVVHGEPVFVFFDMICTIDQVDNPENQIPESSQKATLTNHPNPFNPETTISFNADIDENMVIEIYNIKGQLIKSLYTASSSDTRQNSVIWDGTDQSRNPVSSGIYFATLKSENRILANRKMMLLK